jgi:acyl-CoA thioesterase
MDPNHAPLAGPAPEPVVPLRRMAPGCYSARTDPLFWNQIGPFGGWLAALAMQAMRAEIEPAFAPRSFTAHFLGAVAAGEVCVDVQLHRRQRTVAGLQVTLSQEGRTALVAQAVFGMPRGSVEHGGLAMPQMPSPHALPRWHGVDALARFTHAFDYRLAFGEPFKSAPLRCAGGWLRLAQPTAPAPEALLLLADAWYPPAWSVLAEPAPVSTLSMTALFHSGAPPLVRADDFMAARHRTERVGDGYADERGELWWSDGTLALLTQQLTWIDLAKPHKRLPHGATTAAPALTPAPQPHPVV